MDGGPFSLAEDAAADSATLTVGVEALEAYHADGFGDACNRLVDTGRASLLVDLHRAHNLRSCFIGLIIKLADDAAKAHRRVAVLAAPRVIQVLGVFAAEVGLELRTVAPEGRPES